MVVATNFDFRLKVISRRTKKLIQEIYICEMIPPTISRFISFRNNSLLLFKTNMSIYTLNTLNPEELELIEICDAEDDCSSSNGQCIIRKSASSIDFISIGSDYKAN